MRSSCATVEEYLRTLPAERREAIAAVHQVILDNLRDGHETRIQCGMIAYVVPHALYPAGYHCDPSQPLQYAALASQKNHMALYLMTVYGDPETAAWFRAAWTASGKRLDMGKSCVRFKKLDDLPLDVIAQVIRRVPIQAYIARVEKLLERAPRKRVATG